MYPTEKNQILNYFLGYFNVKMNGKQVDIIDFQLFSSLKLEHANKMWTSWDRPRHMVFYLLALEHGVGIWVDFT